MSTTAGFLSCFIHCPPSPALFTLYEPALFIWSTPSRWLHETHRTGRTDQITTCTGLLSAVRALEVLACQNSYSTACLWETMHNPCKPILLAGKTRWIAEPSKLTWISWKWAGLRRRTRQDLTRIATDGTQGCRRLRHKEPV